LTHSERLALIDPKHPDLSVLRQAKLFDVSRASIYYEPVVSEGDILAMHAIDRIFTDCPFYGSRRIRHELTRTHGITIGRHHVRRLMRLMGLETVYPKHRSTSASNKQHAKYPYLLSGVSIVRPNQVHGTDITYLRLESGFCYLVAHLDWFSRYVLAWELSLSLETTFCIDSLTRALAVAQPEIHNSDQGVQFTSEGYTDVLKAHGITISMDGRGRCFDNIFTERLWRSVKYENVFLKSYRSINEARVGLDEYFQFYNNERPHQSLNYRTPAEVFFDKR